MNHFLNKRHDHNVLRIHFLFLIRVVDKFMDDPIHCLIMEQFLYNSNPELSPTPTVKLFNLLKPEVKKVEVKI